tara:strand:- start:2711 stop:3598 length:888 start_codon:yes stop_codon:yes gene_type:complete
MLPSQQTIYELGNFAPPRIRNIFKAGYYRARWDRIESDALIINGIAKSGQNYMKVLLSNYIAILVDNRDRPTTHQESEADIIPNNRDSYLGDAPYKTPHFYFDALPISDILTGSSTRFLQFCRGRILFLYRNPLDFLVSYYFYKFEYRKSVDGKYARPGEIIDIALDYYLRHYLEIRAIAQTTNSLKVCYENLRIAPFTTLHTIIDWMGLPVNTHTIDKAIEFSEFKKMRAEEDKVGVLHYPDKNNFKGYFTRSGKVGDWKSHLSDDDVEAVRKKLAAAGLSLDNFIIEAPESAE